MSATPGIRRRVGLVFALGVALNYPWEVLQGPLYAGIPDWRFALQHCLPAAAGDGVMVLVVFAAAAMAQRSLDWYRRPAWPGIAAMLGASLLVGVLVEWWAVHWAQRWQYTGSMPRLPGIDVGLVPIAQMLLLPPLAFWLLSRVRS